LSKTSYNYIKGTFQADYRHNTGAVILGQLG